MNKILLILSIFIFSGIFAQSDLQKGVEWYNKRAEGSQGIKAKANPINQAITLFDKALANPDEEEEAALYLLKSYYYKGKFVADNDDEKKEILKKGKEFGEKYISKFPNSTKIRYWYLVNLGSWAEVYGIFAAAMEGVAGIMRENSEKIIEQDPEVEDGGGYFMLGAVHFKSPRIPFILAWPDNDEAVKYLEKAMSTGKAISSQQVYLAKALYKDKQKDRAIKLLEKVVSTKPSDDRPVEDLEQIKEAQVLLKKYKK